ncbi:helix-turn-helix transcriptional regulator [Campylobacter sp. faydin G-105]|uniref:helix-turn-helix domain-containing protein n=1 Tax=Campylobacter anatolicus TaxID=2829105 RepID=UPI001B8F43F6|nr:helix-turn-helix transcriptional regulator [Campylobacter anatolicus]MBR8462466.1 helix-turn-helix transcriptional regulator [Campylobacter anatolicus]
MKEKLGEKIKLILENIRISQRELARRIDFSNSNLKYIEDGINTPSFEVYKNHSRTST